MLSFEEYWNHQVFSIASSFFQCFFLSVFSSRCIFGFIHLYCMRLRYIYIIILIWCSQHKCLHPKQTRLHIEFRINTKLKKTKTLSSFIATLLTLNRYCIRFHVCRCQCNILFFFFLFYFPSIYNTNMYEE